MFKQSQPAHVHDCISSQTVTAVAIDKVTNLNNDGVELQADYKKISFMRCNLKPAGKSFYYKSDFFRSPLEIWFEEENEKLKNN